MPMITLLRLSSGPCLTIISITNILSIALSLPLSIHTNKIDIYKITIYNFRNPKSICIKTTHIYSLYKRKYMLSNNSGRKKGKQALILEFPDN